MHDNDLIAKLINDDCDVRVMTGDYSYDGKVVAFTRAFNFSTSKPNIIAPGNHDLTY